MLDILQRVQQQDAQSGSSEDEAGVGGEDEPCELSEATLAKLLLRVRPTRTPKTANAGMVWMWEKKRQGTLHTTHLCTCVLSLQPESGGT